MTYDVEKHIDHIIDNFDFNIVKIYMENKYSGVIPYRHFTLNELKSIALESMMDLFVDDDIVKVYKHGFVAEKCDDYLILNYNISSSDSISINWSDTYYKDKKQRQRKHKLDEINGLSTEEKE